MVVMLPLRMWFRNDSLLTDSLPEAAVLWRIEHPTWQEGSRRKMPSNEAAGPVNTGKWGNAVAKPEGCYAFMS